jgi:hypothetical protein
LFLVLFSSCFSNESIIITSDYFEES